MERGTLQLGSILSDEDDAVISAITVAEFATGIRLAHTDIQHDLRQAFLVNLLFVLPVVDYTAEIAERHADLLAHTQRAGRKRGPHDLIIAATAAATDRVLLTTDAKAGFSELPGVSVRII
jgi:tRNA(fMet)-specific endonuclease VapC